MNTPLALSVLLLEDDEAFALALEIGLSAKNCQMQHVATGQELEHLLRESSSVAFDLVLLDLKLCDGTSLPYIASVREKLPQAKIIMITGFASIATTVEAMKLGADDYLPKPVTVADILRAYREEPLAVEVGNEVMSPKRVEWEYIQRALQENNGNISRTALQLNMHRRTLQRKLQKKPTQN